MRQVHMGIPQAGDDALSMAVNNLRGITDPLPCSSLISDIYKFAVLDGYRLGMRFRTVQGDGINLSVSVNLVCFLCHLLYLSFL